MEKGRDFVYEAALSYPFPEAYDHDLTSDADRCHHQEDGENVALLKGSRSSKSMQDLIRGAQLAGRGRYASPALE